MSTRYVDGVYRKGRVELLDLVPLVEETPVKVVIEEQNGVSNERDMAQRIERIRRLRGAFRGCLSSSAEFSRRKASEKALER